MKILAFLILSALVAGAIGAELNTLKSFLNENPQEGGRHLAVLVAGSNSFWNYRHQSDVFHAYQILIANGMPEKNIVVLAYDDIASDSSNPFPGKVFNKPDPNGIGVDVYAGVKIDYKGDDVTPANFLSVLSGDITNIKGGNGRALDSNSNDNIFVFFSDHGAAGLIAFPNSELYANDLIKTLKSMSESNKFNKLVFYLEACESGSMFEKILPNNIKVYATTASNSDLSSWATYCSPDDKVNGKSIGSCLGDEYSVNWMEDSDEKSRKKEKESLDAQFKTVKSKTKDSPVQVFGDMTFVNDTIWDYEGNVSSKETSSLATRIINKFEKFAKKIYEKIFGKNKEKMENKIKNKEYKKYLEKAKLSVVNSREVKLKYLYEQAQMKNDLASYDAYENEVIHMRNADSIFKAFNEVYGITDKSVAEFNFDCLKEVVEGYKKYCQWGEYDLKYVKNMALACENNNEIELVKTLHLICKA